ncbi:hypothetical protein [Streptomyces sp. NPDC001657]|uniref:hypothetical protein n=1 Tax=Streptomyces sp. NPDC001657 TaxID=3154522 RepID=UPI00332A7E41
MSDGLIVVLADRGDAGAAAVVSEVAARRTPDHVVVVRSDDLARSRWHHTVGPQGAAATRVTLPDGRVLDSARIGALLHRLPHVPPLGFMTAPLKDRHYAFSELRALLASWLLGLSSRLVGMAMIHAGLSGASPALALACARQSGLRVVPWPGGSGTALPGTPPVPPERLLLAGDTVVGEPGTSCAEPYRRLLGRLGTNLAEVHMVRQGGPGVAGVDLFPPLDLPEHSAAVASLLIDVAARHPVGKTA